MTPLFKKLNLKDQTEIVVLGAPATFEPDLKALRGVTVRRAVPAGGAVTFAIAFVKTLADVAASAEAVLPKAEGDAVVWFAYPKGTSKRYTCEFNRDNGWAAVGAAGFEAVRMVAIDEDWSALRFRRVEHIKNFSRDKSHAISPKGRKRAAGKKGGNAD